MNNQLDEDGLIRSAATDLNAILDHIDEAEGRNDALRAYIRALRDLQYANDQFAVTGKATRADIDRAKARVASAFTRLIICQYSLNLGG